MELAKLSKSKALIWAIAVLAELGLLAIVFQAGMAVGFSKANYNFRWGENYHKLFGGPERGWMMMGTGKIPMMGGGLRRDEFSPGHNVVGTIIKINSSTIIVKGADNVEKSLLIDNTATIRSGKRNIRLSDLKENDQIVAIGSPSTTGQIEVNFLRVFKP